MGDSTAWLKKLLTTNVDGDKPPAPEATAKTEEPVPSGVTVTQNKHRVLDTSGQKRQLELAEAHNAALLNQRDAAQAQADANKAALDEARSALSELRPRFEEAQKALADAERRANASSQQAQRLGERVIKQRAEHRTELERLQSELSKATAQQATQAQEAERSQEQRVALVKRLEQLESLLDSERKDKEAGNIALAAARGDLEILRGEHNTHCAALERQLLELDTEKKLLESERKTLIRAAQQSTSLKQYSDRMHADLVQSRQATAEAKTESQRMQEELGARLVRLETVARSLWQLSAKSLDLAAGAAAARLVSLAHDVSGGIVSIGPDDAKADTLSAAVRRTEQYLEPLGLLDSIVAATDAGDPCVVSIKLRPTAPPYAVHWFAGLALACLNTTLQRPLALHSIQVTGNEAKLTLRGADRQ